MTEQLERAQLVTGDLDEANALGELYLRWHTRGEVLRVGTRLGKGWRHLDSGSYRSAYLSPLGFVYKVPHNLYNNAMQRLEYRFFTRYKDRAWTPPVELFEIGTEPDQVLVIAMPLIRSDDTHISPQGEHMIREARDMGVQDINGVNYRVVNSLPVILDGGNLSFHVHQEFGIQY